MGGFGGIMKFTELYRAFTINRWKLITDNGKYEVKIFKGETEIFSIFDTENNIEDTITRFLCERWFISECLKTTKIDLNSKDYSLTISGYIKKTEEFK